MEELYFRQRRKKANTDREEAESKKLCPPPGETRAFRTDFLVWSALTVSELLNSMRKDMARPQTITELFLAFCHTYRIFHPLLPYSFLQLKYGCKLWAHGFYVLPYPEVTFGLGMYSVLSFWILQSPHLAQPAFLFSSELLQQFTLIYSSKSKQWIEFTIYPRQWVIFRTLHCYPSASSFLLYQSPTTHHLLKQKLVLLPSLNITYQQKNNSVCPPTYLLYFHRC